MQKLSCCSELSAKILHVLLEMGPSPNQFLLTNWEQFWTIIHMVREIFIFGARSIFKKELVQLVHD